MKPRQVLSQRPPCKPSQQICVLHFHGDSQQGTQTYSDVLGGELVPESQKHRLTLPFHSLSDQSRKQARPKRTRFREFVHVIRNLLRNFLLELRHDIPKNTNRITILDRGRPASFLKMKREIVRKHQAKVTYNNLWLMGKKLIGVLLPRLRVNFPKVDIRFLLWFSSGNFFSGNINNVNRLRRSSKNELRLTTSDFHTPERYDRFGTGSNMSQNIFLTTRNCCFQSTRIKAESGISYKINIKLTVEYLVEGKGLAGKRSQHVEGSHHHHRH